MENNIKYVSFMRSYFDAAKTIAAPEDRLAFYEAIFTYGFDGIEFDFTDNPQLNGLFTLVKPFIDANKKRVKQNQINGSKHKSGLTHGISDGMLLDREIDKDTDNNNDTDINKDIDIDNLETTTYIHSFLVENNIDTYSEKDINKTLKDYDLDKSYLDFVLNTVKAKYPKNTKKQNSAMFNQAYKWGDLLAEYMDSSKKEEAPAAPTKCTECGATLLSNGWGSRICPACREKGKIIWWELDSGKWEKQQQTM